MFEPEGVTDAINKFDAIVLKERMRYQIIYETIENYMTKFTDESGDSLIILGGTMSVDLLLGKPLGRDDFIYNLFSDDAFRHCNTLANLIAEEIVKIFADNTDPLNNPYWTVIMKTVGVHKKFDILVDQRVLVRFTVLKTMSEDSNLYKLIQPLTVKSYFQKKTILIIPPRFHLIEIYRDLYSPIEFDSWQSALIDERRLFGYMKHIMNLQRAGKSVVVGSEDINLNQRKLIATTIMDEFIKNNQKTILLGEHAIHILTDCNIDTPIIHCMIDFDLSLKDIEPTLTNIVSKCVNRPIRLLFSTRNVQILSDFRLNRTSVKLDGKEIMYIYNSTNYDLIPVNKIYDNKKNVIQIGNPFVLIRFMLIEIWIINWIVSIDKIDESFAKSRINSMIGKVLGLRSKLSKISDIDHVHASIDERFLLPGNMQILQTQSENYIGQYESDDKAQKTKALTSQRFFDYLPQETLRKNGKYRYFNDKL
jgi:hypothetical protein